ncbi:MAG: metallophosphoesterase [Clostridiales bacterium]|nr:metallophosphoesterase [Clostridiales bacterium]
MVASKERVNEIVQYVENNIDKSPIEVAQHFGFNETDTVRKYLHEAGRVEDLWYKLKEDNNSKQNDRQNNKVEFKSKGNKAELSSKSERIKTLDDLIEEANIDLDTWEIDHYTENKWNGQKTGGEPVKLYQVKAYLKRKEVIKQKFEPVQPISVASNYRKPNKPKDSQLNSAVIIPDTHIGYRRKTQSQEMIPFHDRRALDLAHQIVEYEKPELIILLGDFLDMPEWTKKFRRSHEFSRITQASVNEGHWWLRQFRENAPDAKIVLLSGNHDSRIPKFLMDNNKAAYKLKSADKVEKRYGAMSVPNLLDLEGLNIEWRGGYPDSQYWINDNLVAEHGDRVSSVNGKSAGQILDDARESHIFGHTHRLEMATKTCYPRKGPTSYQSVTLGCLCNLGGPTPAKSQRNDWQNGLGVVEFQTGNNPFYIQPIYINDGSMIYKGKVFEGSSKLDKIKDEAKVEKYNFVEYDR